MKLKIPLLKGCAIAVTLLSLTHFTGYAEDVKELALAHSQAELMASAEKNVFSSDTLFESLSSEDLLLQNEDFASSLVAGVSKKSKKNKASPPKVELSQTDNTWIPRFVWMGDVQNNEDLKCFAAFLIGSMGDQKNLQTDQNFDPGIFMTADSQTTARADYNSSAFEDNITAQKQKKWKKKSNNPPPHQALQAPTARISLSLDAGLSFLYFDKYRGNLCPKPQAFFPKSGVPGSLYPVNGRAQTNLTPFFEMSTILNFFKWLGFGAYLQSDQGIYMRSKPWIGTSRADAFQPNQPLTLNFESSLALNAVGGKLVLNFDNLMKFKTWCMGFFISAGAGYGVQTWSNSHGYIGSLPTNGDYTTTYLTWSTRYAQNFTYTGDFSLSFKSRNPLSALTKLKFGCKFVAWGRVRGLGKASSTEYITGYWKPIYFRGIYSMVPYMGFNWAF